METINNMASAAAKAVWGGENQTQEPVSGRTGDTAKGEPYDAGNLDETGRKTDEASRKTDETSHKPDSAAVHAKTTGTAKEPESVPDTPSANLKKNDVPADTTKGQNDVRDPEDPQTHPKGAPTDVDDTGDGPNKPQKLDGPGPRPLTEVAREHGGDAGSKETTAGKNESSGSGESAGGAHAPGAPGAAAPGADPNDEVHEKSKGEGTGEQYVKSSGLKADGGDFDATKPGAGREADRLLEEKGIHPASGPSKGEPSDTSKGPTSKESANTSDDKEKVSLKDKIKAKLHKN